MAQCLDLDRCPWCNAATPTLELKQKINESKTLLTTCLYQCSRCFKHVMANHIFDKVSGGFHPSPTPYNTVYPNSHSRYSDAIPKRAREFLEQARDTIHAPDASIMVCASALDIMLQSIGRLKDEGNLSARIGKAAEKHQITQDMAKWAHQIRLLANESRHPDENDVSATIEEAKQSLEFLGALAQLLFVLPARVQKGIENANAKTEQKKK